MALNISGYVDPGAYVGEVITPSALTVNTVPLIVGLVGVAARTKQSTNESVARGSVLNEALTLAGSSPHTASFLHPSNRLASQTTILRDGAALPPAQWVFLPAQATGATNAGTIDFSTANLICLTLDSNKNILIELSGAGNATPDGPVTQVGPASSNMFSLAVNNVTTAAMTLAKIAYGINLILSSSAVTSAGLGYGTAYASVATVVNNKLVITSPINTSSSLVHLRDPAAVGSATSAMTTLFGAVFTNSLYIPPTQIQVLDASYASTSVYTANYISTVSTLDPLAHTSVQSVSRVGNFAGVTNYTPGIDYNLNGDDIDWSLNTPAKVTGVVAATFNLSTNNKVKLAIDGKTAIEMNLADTGSTIPGYNTGITTNAVTLAQLVTNINAELKRNVAYGEAYASVASTAGGAIVLTSPTQGAAGLIEFSAPSANDATNTIFGITSNQYPFDARGVGAEPAYGNIYFVTYNFTRPSTDYEKAFRLYSTDDLYAQVGQTVQGNALAIAGELCFLNGAPSIIVVQVNDSTTPGSPTITQVENAITNGADNSGDITELVVLDTRVTVQGFIVTDVANQSSPTAKHYRRAWLGMPAGTQIGDSNTPNTFVYAAINTFQVAPDSPGRGRYTLVAPDQAKRTITNPDGSESTLTLDGSYIAAAVAGLFTSFTSPSQNLLRKQIVGFDPTTFPTYLAAQRGTLASSGVCVITASAGKLTLTDPVTTEYGVGALPEFSDPSAMAQKDVTTVAIQNVIDSNLVGVVPDDLATFIISIKQYVALTLRSLISSGAIGQFRDSNGNTRDINLSTDIVAYQSPTDPTKFYFNYFFFLKYPAKRFFGQFSVDNPFFKTS